MNEINSRLKKYLALKRQSIREFERICGLSNGLAARIGSTTNPSTLRKISTSCDINVDWLLTGEGEMLNDPPCGVVKADKQVEQNPSSMEAHVVPLIPTAALANSLSEYLGPGIRRIDCQNIVSPVPGAEFAITISGDSMEPKFHDGMVVFLKRINEAAFIPWGNTLVLDTENGAFIKNVYPCDDDDELIEARSINSHYPVMKIPKKSIFGMYRVLNATKFFTTM